jgi:hypothetical protein
LSVTGSGSHAGRDRAVTVALIGAGATVAAAVIGAIGTLAASSGNPDPSGTGALSGAATASTTEAVAGVFHRGRLPLRTGQYPDLDADPRDPTWEVLQNAPDFDLMWNGAGDPDAAMSFENGAGGHRRRRTGETAGRPRVWASRDPGPVPPSPRAAMCVC